MSTQTVSKKRKSADGNITVSKKVKMAKSAEKAAPLKSALKRPGLETSEKTFVTNPHNGGTVVTKTTKSRAMNGETTEAMEKMLVQDTATTSPTLTADQTAALLAGFSSSEDEADSEAEEESGIAISSLPKAPTTGAIQKRIKQAISTDADTTPGVIYIGRIPHGFFERQMKAYFSQFGEITNLRLARNRKTGASQHHAFVEFASVAVADIVAKTMDKYLLFNHILQVRRVPREQVQEGMFKGRTKKPAPRNRFEARKLRMGATRAVWGKRVEVERKRREEKAEKLREMGYEFEMPPVKSVGDVPIKQLRVDEVTAGGDGDGGVELLENGNDVLEVAQIGQVDPQQAVHVEETTTKKRPASGKTQTKKVVKKVKA